MKKSSVTLLLAVVLCGCGGDERETGKRPQPTPPPTADGGARGANGTGSGSKPGEPKLSPQSRRFLRAGRRSCSLVRREAGRVDATVTRELVDWSRRAAPAAARRRRELSRLDPPARDKRYDQLLEQADLNAQILRRLAQINLRSGGPRDGAAQLGRMLVRFEHELQRRATRVGLEGCGSLTR